MSDFEDVYMVFDFMETDMHKIIYSKNDLTDDHCQYFAYQMLRGLKYVHSGASPVLRNRFVHPAWPLALLWLTRPLRPQRMCSTAT